jgi:hypothetical protein
MQSLIVGDSLSNSREQLNPLGFSPKTPPGAVTFHDHTDFLAGKRLQL